MVLLKQFGQTMDKEIQKAALITVILTPNILVQQLKEKKHLPHRQKRNKK